MDIKLTDRTLGELEPGTLFSFTPGKAPDHLRLAHTADNGNPFHASFCQGTVDGTKPTNTPVYTARERTSFGQLKPGALFIGGGRYCLKAEASFCARGIHHREAYNAITTEGHFVRFEDSTEVTPIAGPLEIKY